MTDIARLPFQSRRDPVQHGELILSDEGTVRLEPGEAMRDALAAQEEAALAKVRLWGDGLGFALIGLGAAALAAGWYAGRVFGKIGYTVSRPRRIEELTLEPTKDGGLRLENPHYHVIPAPPQTVWESGEVDPDKASEFLQAVETLRRTNQTSLK